MSVLGNYKREPNSPVVQTYKHVSKKAVCGPETIVYRLQRSEGHEG